MKKLKVVFMGTPEFSVPILDNLIKNTNVVLVVTMPDAYVGRKRILSACPVKEHALKNNIEVFSPANIKEDYDKVIEFKPDIIITCAYGQILPKELLDYPSLGSINIHASLLPKYRGGAPIHRAIMNGDKETGITIMYMDESMDSGDMITKESINIEDADTLETLSSKLSLLGSTLIIKTLPSIINKTNERVPQDIEKVTYAPIINREDEKINFNLAALEVFNLVRALTPEPLAYFTLDDKEYKIAKCNVTEGTGKPGTIIKVDKNSMTIMCKDKGVEVLEIKPPGKKIMTVRDFFNGNKKEDFLGKEVL